MKSFKEFRESIKFNKGVKLSDLIYHGSPERKVENILKDGVLKPRRDGEQMNAGLITERDFVYFGNYDTARFFAMGGERNMLRSTKELEKPGAIFKMLPHHSNYRIIDMEEPLKDEQIKIVNDFLPDYKPLNKGEALSRFVWRTNKPDQFSEVVKALGYNAYLQSGNQLGILGEVECEMVKDLRGVKIPKPRPEQAKVEVTPKGKNWDRSIQI